MEALSVANALFSKVQQRVLALIFGRPERSFYTSEIVRNVRSGTGAVERELSRLQRSGLVSIERIGNQKHYRANHRSPVFEELQSLVVKTVALTEPLGRALAPYADKIKTPIELSCADLYTALRNAETVLQRKVSPIFLAPEEWRRKTSRKNSVISKIAAQPKIFIIGSEEDIRYEQTGTQ